ncbi:MAG: TetR/AcrR family transcriptional regulator [Acidimicrobiales bacterium]|nr:TetR/AcrR family transcriptional regulator [Acidimicrobiales bacterium]
MVRELAEPHDAEARGLHVVDPDVPAASAETTERILDATVTLVARWGVAKTALGDVAKEAGCSRATLYRAFPGGKQHLLLALGERELGAYVAAIAEVIDAADDLDDALTRGLVVATRLLHDHAAAQFVFEHEPGLLLPFLGFREVDVLYRHTSIVIGPHLERFLPADRAAWAAEWAARLFISFIFNPHPGLDLADVDDARGLVRRFVLPAFAADTSDPTIP